MLPTAKCASRLPLYIPRTFAPQRPLQSSSPFIRASGCLCSQRRFIRQRRIPPGSSSANNNASSNDPSPNEPSEPSPPPSSPSNEPSKIEAVSNALATTPSSENALLTPVHIPPDPAGVLHDTHPAMRILDNSAIVVQRQLEMMNVLMGFEQANRYVIMDPQGNHIGYLAEQEHGVGNAVARQMFRTHRSFTTHVFDREEKEVLRFHRPFSWINSRIRVYDAVGKGEGAYTSTSALQGTSAASAMGQSNTSISSLDLRDMRIIGSAEQEWAPLRRKYNMFLARNLEDTAAAPGTPQLSSGDLPLSESKAVAVVEGDSREVGMLQFARVDEPFLSWDFSLRSEDSRLIGSVNRNFAGFAREIFTDTGVYALRMDAAGLAAQPSQEPGQMSLEEYPGMTLDQRAVMLATAVSIDFDYFSRHSGSSGMWPMFLPWWGGEAAGGAAGAAGGAAAGEAGAAGAGAVGAASEAGVASEATAAARGLGSSEGWMAGAGTMAGYEAMQRGREARQEQQQAQADDQSPQAAGPYEGSPSQSQHQGTQQGGEDVWGVGQDPGADDDFWGGRGGSSGGDNAPGGGDGDGGGFSWGDFFDE